jgi:hypothetical protein
MGLFSDIKRLLMMTFRYINKNQQPTFTSYTLLIEDDFENVTRIEKTFKTDSRQIDDEFLRSIAATEMTRIKYELENPTEIPLEIPPIEEALNGDFIE